ncbi:DUF1573 domain-containing protein [Neolewinella agarilytica]|uniref:DUF1573 domain-containing protein n=1 Tax=Neolewinella agarilytica TaxID=478744 RepID=A0A1H9MUC4_9BACT|nr:DUF1573 domain-containing protein [Neolewinella agarilytica]SER27191.1 Protein of unknown function [Neolewinella agarilytica]
MFKQFLSLVAVLALAITVSSCQNANDDVRDAARQTVETVTPANPAAAQPAPAVAVPTGPVTTMAFKDNGTFDFGTVTEGEIVSHTFSFTNTGSEPLIISDAKGSCGCTVPSKPTAPIAPGEDGEITVQFNSKNKKGARNQKVTVTANTNPAQTFIYLTGTVNPDPNAVTQ